MKHYCSKHGVDTTEHKSKTKFNEDGTPKTYWGHFVTGEGICFGDKDTKPQQVSEYKDEPSFATMPQPTDERNTLPTAQRQETREPIKQEVDWDGKERVSIAQTSMKSASEIYASLIAVSAVKVGNTDELIENVNTMANRFFLQIMGKKSGN